MSRVPEHDIHVTRNKSGKGYRYEICFENEAGSFAVSAKDAQTCEDRFRKQYRKAYRRLEEALESECFADPSVPDDNDVPAEASPEDDSAAEQGASGAPAEEQAPSAKSGAADPGKKFRMESQDMGDGRRIKVELNQDNLPRDLGNLAALYFDVVYKQDPDMSPDDLAKDRDVFNLLVVDNNETKAMNFLDSEEVQNACNAMAENGNPETAERIQVIVDKMKSIAGGIYSIRREIQHDMQDKFNIMSDRDIAALLNGTAGTRYQLMFAVPLFMGIDISQRRQIKIHKGFVSTTTDMDEKDEMKMYHYYMTGNLDSFIIDNCSDDGPLGSFKDKKGRYKEHCIGLTIGNPDELEGILEQHCPGHSLKDLYATFWVRGLD
ncbi:MAG: hypothetical protein LUD51_04105 [Clostridia bacterium]|nr:hypothetical protein [Clostridia bacterium]